MTTNQNLTAAEKTAYNKGWASTAKSEMLAINGFAKKEADADLQRMFGAGYVDKHSGAEKWTSVKDAPVFVGTAADEDLAAEATADVEPVSAPTQVEVDGTVVAETRHTELTYPEGGATARSTGRVYVTIPELKARITKDTTADDVRAIRDEISLKKRHYIMGWNSFSSTLFAGDFDKAIAGYEKRHGAADKNIFIEDWTKGFEDHEQGRAKGASWA